MATSRKIAKSLNQDKSLHVGITLGASPNGDAPSLIDKCITLDIIEPITLGDASCITEDEPYHSGITCEDTVSEDERRFNEHLESELKLSEMRQSYRKKNTPDYDAFADDEQDENDIFDEYYDEDYVDSTLHRKCTKTLLSWDEISVPDWDEESYLGTCSESEFAFDDTVEQPNIPRTEHNKFDIAPEDDEDLRPRPRGTHTKPSAYVHTQCDEDDEQGYWELLPGARRFGTI